MNDDRQTRPDDATPDVPARHEPGGPTPDPSDGRTPADGPHAGPGSTGPGSTDFTPTGPGPADADTAGTVARGPIPNGTPATPAVPSDGPPSGVDADDAIELAGAVDLAVRRRLRDLPPEPMPAEVWAGIVAALRAEAAGTPVDARPLSPAPEVLAVGTSAQPHTVGPAAHADPAGPGSPAPAGDLRTTPTGPHPEPGMGGPLATVTDLAERRRRRGHVLAWAAAAAAVVIAVPTVNGLISEGTSTPGGVIAGPDGATASPSGSRGPVWVPTPVTMAALPSLGRSLPPPTDATPSSASPTSTTPVGPSPAGPVPASGNAADVATRATGLTALAPTSALQGCLALAGVSGARVGGATAVILDGRTALAVRVRTASGSPRDLLVVLAAGCTTGDATAVLATVDLG